MATTLGERAGDSPPTRARTATRPPRREAVASDPPSGGERAEELTQRRPAEVSRLLHDPRVSGPVANAVQPASSQSKIAHTRSSSIGSRYTVEPFDPCDPRLSAPAVL